MNKLVKYLKLILIIRQIKIFTCLSKTCFFKKNKKFGLPTENLILMAAVY